MSYVNMDHAAWVQDQLNGSKRRATKSERAKAAETSRGWAAAPDELNAFHKRAFTILGIVGGGIYNAPIAWKSIYWQPRTIIVSWYSSLGTWDFNQLTRFVFLCHEARIRGCISPLAPRYLEIMLNERVADGPVSLRHPNLLEALNAWRAEFPGDHPLVYQPPNEAAEAAE